MQRRRVRDADDQPLAGEQPRDGLPPRLGTRAVEKLEAVLKEWRTTLVDDNGMACEDLCLADLNGDGKLDIVAAGRGTKNVKIYFNESAR